MNIIDGKAISKQIKDEVKEKVAALKAQGVTVTLAVVQVGNDPASSVYVNNKKKACAYTGMESENFELPEETTQEELLSLIEELNGRKEINGILVQLPLPKHIDENAVIRAISPKKDVDGFHPQSVGALCIGQPGFVSCTPAGIIELLKRSGIEIAGKECVIIGRSNINAQPLAFLNAECMFIKAKRENCFAARTVISKLHAQRDNVVAQTKIAVVTGKADADQKSGVLLV